MNARVRRAQRAAVLARFGPALVLMAAETVRFVQMSGPAYWLLMYGAVVLTSAAHLLFGGNRPVTWTPAAILTSALAGAVMGATVARHWPVAADLLTDPGYRYPILAGVAIVPLTIVGVSLGMLALKKLMEPFTIELADTPLEIPFPLQNHHGHLLVAPDYVTLHDGKSRLTRRLREVTSVKHFRQGGTEHLRLMVAGKEWLLPMDQAAQAAQVVNRRSARQPE